MSKKDSTTSRNAPCRYCHNGMYGNIIRVRTEMVCNFIDAYPTALKTRWRDLETDFFAWALREGIDVSDAPYRMACTMNQRSFGAVKRYHAERGRRSR